MKFGVGAGQASCAARSGSPTGTHIGGGTMGICNGGGNGDGASCRPACGSVMSFGQVLLILCLGHFICQFAIAGLGLRYLRINYSERLGHPLRNPLQTAFRRVEILGLHNEWCMNFTPFALVFTECVKLARVTPGCISGRSFRARSTTGADHGRADRMSRSLMGRVHRLVELSLWPHKITLQSYITSHLFLSKITVKCSSRRVDWWLEYTKKQYTEVEYVAVK